MSTYDADLKRQQEERAFRAHQEALNDEAARARRRDYDAADAQERFERLERFVALKARIDRIELPEDKAPPYAHGPFTSAELESVAEDVFVPVALVEDVLAGRPCWPGKRARVVARLDAIWQQVDVPAPEEPSQEGIPVLGEDEDPSRLSGWRLRQLEEAYADRRRQRREYEEWKTRRDAREVTLRREGKLPGPGAEAGNGG